MKLFLLLAQYQSASNFDIDIKIIDSCDSRKIDKQ